MLERVIHGDDDEADEDESGGRSEETRNDIRDGGGVGVSEPSSSRPSWASDDGTGHASSARGQGHSGSSGQSAAAGSQSSPGSDARATKLSSSADERRGSWFQGMFRSKKDKEKEANMGNELKAYFDKQLGKWVFPDQEGNAEDEDGAGMDVPPMNAPPMMAAGPAPPPMAGNHHPPMGAPQGMPPQGMPPQGTSPQGMPPQGAPGGLPLGSQPRAGAISSTRPRRQSRYASFGMPVIAAGSTTTTEESSLGTPSSLSNRPGGACNTGPQIPGVF